jgi:hypothetical protein
MKQKLAHGFGLMILKVSMAVLLDMSVVKESLVIFNTREGIADLPSSRAQSLHFGAFQNNARLKRLKDVIIATGFGIGKDFSHKQNSQKTALLAAA